MNDIQFFKDPTQSEPFPVSCLDLQLMNLPSKMSIYDVTVKLGIQT